MSHLEDRLLDPDHLEELLAGLLRRREAHAEKLKGRIVELRKQAADAEAKLTRLYHAIEEGLAELDDANLKGRILELKRICDSARADADRAENRGEGTDHQITPELLRRFAADARAQVRSKDGGFRRHHLQALVQRVEIGADEIRIRGSKPRLLQTLVASVGKHGVETAAHGVRSFALKWLAGLNEATNFESPIPLERPPQLPQRRKRDRDREERLRLAGGPKPSLREKAYAFAQERATVRTCDFTAIGIPRHYLAWMCEEGLLVKVGYGIYRVAVPKAA